MTIDYDAPRPRYDDAPETAASPELTAAAPQQEEPDEAELADSYTLPGADLSGEELPVQVLPQQQDEFTCTRCFLVHHRSQLVTTIDGRPVCTECAA